MITHLRRKANRDLGRIFKTEFILHYLSEPQLRRRIRHGLLKVEQLHALARDVFYGRRGRINARELWARVLQPWASNKAQVAAIARDFCSFMDAGTVGAYKDSPSLSRVSVVSGNLVGTG
jgi:Tn3 transposase DDE domain